MECYAMEQGPLSSSDQTWTLSPHLEQTNLEYASTKVVTDAEGNEDGGGCFCRGGADVFRGKIE